jgi:hypothetical protein
MEVASCHSVGAKDFKVASRFLERLCISSASSLWHWNMMCAVSVVPQSV